MPIPLQFSTDVLALNPFLSRQSISRVPSARILKSADGFDSQLERV